MADCCKDGATVDFSLTGSSTKDFLDDVLTTIYSTSKKKAMER
jgi:hypothetical protein